MKLSSRTEVWTEKYTGEVDVGEVWREGIDEEPVGELQYLCFHSWGFTQDYFFSFDRKFKSKWHEFWFFRRKWYKRLFPKWYRTRWPIKIDVVKEVRPYPEFDKTKLKKRDPSICKHIKYDRENKIINIAPESGNCVSIMDLYWCIKNLEDDDSILLGGEQCLNDS